MVAGMPGAVTKVTVKLNSITHTKPTDIDMLLIGPGGQTAIMMSHAGGGFPGITNVTLTLDDFAANQLPDGSSASTVVTGTYQPTNYGRSMCSHRPLLNSCLLPVLLSQSLTAQIRTGPGRSTSWITQ